MTNTKRWFTLTLTTVMIGSLLLLTFSIFKTTSIPICISRLSKKTLAIETSVRGYESTFPYYNKLELKQACNDPKTYNTKHPLPSFITSRKSCFETAEDTDVFTFHHIVKTAGSSLREVISGDEEGLLSNPSSSCDMNKFVCDFKTRGIIFGHQHMNVNKRVADEAHQACEQHRFRKNPSFPVEVYKEGDDLFSCLEKNTLLSYHKETPYHLIKNRGDVKIKGMTMLRNPRDQTESNFLYVRKMAEDIMEKNMNFPEDTKTTYESALSKHGELVPCAIIIVCTQTTNPAPMLTSLAARLARRVEFHGLVQTTGRKRG